MESDQVRKICGIVMPISAIDGCLESHWIDVKGIISEAILAAGFEPNLVSDADEIGVIQKRIIQNLYDNPIVVCDVSAKNANVMFELGLRLAFDRPTIIIKDDMTNYSFDTSSIEHLEYPRDLRYSKILDFKARLAFKIKATYEASLDSENYTTFLKHFGQFKVAKLDEKEVPSEELILDELAAIRRSISRLDLPASSVKSEGRRYARAKVSDAKTAFVPVPSLEIAKALAAIYTGNDSFRVITSVNDSNHLGVAINLIDESCDIFEAVQLVKSSIKDIS